MRGKAHALHFVKIREVFANAFLPAVPTTSSRRSEELSYFTNDLYGNAIDKRDDEESQ
jgi:hypothetical protein